MSADKQSSPADSPWGRVTEDGTVFVRTTDGERSVGQYPEGTPIRTLCEHDPTTNDVSDDESSRPQPVPSD